MTEPTKFLEANALLYVQQGDKTAAYDCLREMLPGELSALAESAERLAGMANWTAELKRRSRPHTEQA